MNVLRKSLSAATHYLPGVGVRAGTSFGPLDVPRTPKGYAPPTPVSATLASPCHAQPCLTLPRPAACVAVYRYAARWPSVISPRSGTCHGRVELVPDARAFGVDVGEGGGDLDLGGP